MRTYVVLIRGINVGGKNKVPMAELRKCLETECGCENVQTYIASGNAIVDSTQSAKALQSAIEGALPKRFRLDVDLVRVLVLTHKQLQSVIDDRPTGFGDRPDEFHSDAVFLMGIPMQEALAVFDPRDGVDQIWPGTGVIYSQRLSAQRTRSRLSKIMGTKPYQSMTIRNWNTTTKLLALLKARST
jgi:uncharacterized protein (DUF1697 family)